MTHSDCFTLAMTSPQAASLSAWLQRCELAAVDGTSAQVLADLAAQLEDSRWLGRWLREEARLAISHEDSAAISQALHAAIAIAPPSDQEELALKRVLVATSE
jgi:hypothetical protein